MIEEIEILKADLNHNNTQLYLLSLCPKNHFICAAIDSHREEIREIKEKIKCLSQFTKTTENTINK